MRVRCNACEKVTRGRMPRFGDGTFYLPARHVHEIEMCYGVWEEGEILSDNPTSDNTTATDTSGVLDLVDDVSMMSVYINAAESRKEFNRRVDILKYILGQVLTMIAPGPWHRRPVDANVQWTPRALPKDGEMVLFMYDGMVNLGNYDVVREAFVDRSAFNASDIEGWMYVPPFTPTGEAREVPNGEDDKD